MRCLINFEYDSDPLEKPGSVCMFDMWSLHHGYYHGLLYIILHILLKIKKKKHVILLNIILIILHIIEEILDNNTFNSFQHYFIKYIGPILDNKIDVKKIKQDHDSIYNSIGDVLSGAIVTVFISLYWFKYKNIPYIYFIGIIPIIISLLDKAKTLH